MTNEGAHLFLDLLLKERSNCERPGAPGEAVQRFLRDCLFFVRAIMTDQVFERAMRSAEDGQGVLLLANRIAQLEPLLGDNWPSDFSFEDLTSELFGVANGDAPRILRSDGKQGKFSNAHALLEGKLEALSWHKVLREVGLSAPERDCVIMSDYSISSSAINDWRKEARRKLGPDYVDRFLVTSIQAKLFQAAQQEDAVIWAKEQAGFAGDRYRQELGRSRA